MDGSFVEAEGLRLHYLEQGTGPPVLLLHGWPTSSYLWRDLLGPMSEHNRMIALDLPGFGHSDKPLDASYSFRFYDRAIDGFLDALGLDAVGLAVHDLGGPAGLYWASQHHERVSKLALLNTIVFARPSWAAVAFVAACRIPGIRSWMVTPAGIARAMKLGVSDSSRLGDDAIRAYQEPFEQKDARRALLKAGTGLHPGGFKEIDGWLRGSSLPIRIVYGEDDRILPDVARTMGKVADMVDSSPEVTAMPGCGHFLQEERPAEIAAELSTFFR